MLRVLVGPLLLLRHRILRRSSSALYSVFRESSRRDPTSAKMSSHKPGTLKQTNKKHKGNAGKRAQVKLMGPGKTNRKSVKCTTLKALPSKAERVNRNRQIAKQKREAVWLQKRMGAGGGGGGGGEVSCKVVGIIPLSDMADPNNCMQECLQQMGARLPGRTKSAGPSVTHALNGPGHSGQQLGMYVCMCVCVYMYICVYVYMCMCICVY
jgi:hypothetical protein